MTPSTILSAVRLGESALRKHHASLRLLWAKFGIAIASARNARGMSRSALGRKLGYTGQMIALLERNERHWPMAKAEKAVHLLQRPEQWPDCGRPPTGRPCKNR